MEDICFNQNPLGISIGWADLYSVGIPQQRIDVTGLASGQYWLEVVVDPNNIVQETDETNNTTQILVDLELSGLFDADFDLDGDVDQLDLSDPTNGWESRFGVDLDGLNFLTRQQQLGYGIPQVSSASVATIPEPAAIALLVAGLVTATFGGRSVVYRRSA